MRQQAKSVNQIFDLFYVLPALSVVVSLFGIVNTLVLAVFERTRELGMLRAIGMTRRQMRRMIRHESIITALIGGALGLPLGVFLAALVTRGLSSLGVGFHVPVDQLVIFGWSSQEDARDRPLGTDLGDRLRVATTGLHKSPILHRPF